MCVLTGHTEAIGPWLKECGMNTFTSTCCGKSFGLNNLYAYYTVKQVGRPNDSTSTQTHGEFRDCKEEYSWLFNFGNHCFRNVNVEYTSGIICLWNTDKEVSHALGIALGISSRYLIAVKFGPESPGLKKSLNL